MIICKIWKMSRQDELKKNRNSVLKEQEEAKELILQIQKQNQKIQELQKTR